MNIIAVLSKFFIFLPASSILTNLDNNFNSVRKDCENNGMIPRLWAACKEIILYRALEFLHTVAAYEPYYSVYKLSCRLVKAAKKSSFGYQKEGNNCILREMRSFLKTEVSPAVVKLGYERVGARSSHIRGFMQAYTGL